MKITLVDDEPVQLVGLVKIINSLPDLSSVVISSQDQILNYDYSDTDLLFLDHCLYDNVSGEDVLAKIKDTSFHGMVCSISGSDRSPAYMEDHGGWHFAAKNFCMRSPSAIYIFIATINAMIDCCGMGK